MDILEIAAREGNEAYTAAEGGPEAKAEAYYTAHKATLERGRKAEEILTAGGVEQHGEAGWYHVASQSSDRYYVVNLDDRDCSCPDHQERDPYCKHLQAAELFADTRDPGLSRAITEADGEQVALEIEGYARGRQVLDKKLKRVRVNGGSYRKAKTQDFDAALAWLRGEGYELANTAKPPRKMGSVTVRYIYRKPETQAHDDALPVQHNRRRDRLFKSA